MSEEIPDEAVAEMLSKGYAELPNGHLLMGMPIGYQGAAQHTYTSACAGFHEPGPCPPSQVQRFTAGPDGFPGEPSLIPGFAVPDDEASR